MSSSLQCCRSIAAEDVTESPAPGSPAGLVYAAAFLARKYAGPVAGVLC